VRHPHTRPPAGRLAALGLAAAVVLAACGSPAAAAADPDPADWSAVTATARGQTLHWYLYNGDEAVNAFVDGYVKRRLADGFGVTLDVVGVTDTADAVNKVLAQQQAGRTTDGTVDAIWVNGENFATGRQAGIWYCGYPAALPNARYVDRSDPSIVRDFGVPVEGCEAAWQRADSALVYDSARLGAADVASLSALGDWARAHPGLFTYPAPPDFTGSMVVRTFLYDSATDRAALGGPFDATTFAPTADRLWARLNALEPSLWRAGATYPTSQDAVEQLYATGEIAAYFTYGPGTVATKVADGVYPASTREAVPLVGNIGNVSNVAIPASSPHKAAALVLANVLQDPASQLEFYTSAGVYPAIDIGRTSPQLQQRLAAVDPGPSVLPLRELTARSLPELDAGYVTAVEDGWTANVLQR